MRRAGAAAWAALAALPVAIAVAVYGLKDHYRFADEAIGIFGGRQLQADFWGQVLDPQFSSRPLERGLALLWWAALEITPSTSGAFQLAHVVLGVVAASAAIPVALLLRGLGTRTPWAVAGGVIAVLGPWAIFGVTLLNNAPGMTTFAWLLLAGQRVIREPGWRSDLLFCAAALLVGVTRAGNLPLAAGLAPAVAWAVWARSGGSVRGFATELVRRHWILLGVLVVAMGVLAVRGFDGLFGSYGAGRSTYLPWDLLLTMVRNIGGHLAVATGVIAFAFAVPWVVRAIVRPAGSGVTPERALGLTAVTTGAIFAYVYAPALIEDRYFLTLTPLVVVPFVHAVTVRPLGLGWMAAGAGVLAFFLARGTSWPQSDDALIQVPATQWWNRVVEGRLSSLPLDADVLSVAGGALLALVLGVALVRGDARIRRWAPAVTIGLVLVHQAASAGWLLQTWSDSRGRADVTFDELTFVDRAVPDGDVAMLLRANPTRDLALPIVWDDLAYWNQQLSGSLDIEEHPICCLNGNVPLAWDDGGVLTVDLFGDHVVTSLASSVSLVGRTVLTERSQGYRVDRVAEPARMAYVATAQVPGRLSLDVFPRNAEGSGRPCLTGEIAQGTLVTIDGERGRVARGGGKPARVLLGDANGLEVDLLHPLDRAPADLRVERC